MALDIVTQDIIIDETSGLQDNDVDSTLPAHNNATVQYLLGLDDPGGLTPPEVAFKANFVVASAGAGETTSIVLTQNLAGVAFSTTVGVKSDIQTVDGNYVWLFQDSTHANIVIGVIGSSDPNAEQPDVTGPLAFSFALLSTSSTNADLYTVQYVPLFHPDATNPDDQIDLTDHVFASVTGTTVANFSGQNAAPGNHDFYLINSSGGASNQLLVTGFLGAANATANVSTQGFGVNNQSINPTETLQCDFVTGGNLAAGSASQIQYGSHLDGVMQAGFTINQITPSNPNLRVDIKITALDVTGNEQGLNFYDGSSTTPAPITSLTLTGQSGFASAITANGTYNVAGNVDVIVSGLGTGIVTITGLDNITTVNITTSSQMDRLLVTGVDSNEGCDITEFHFSTTSTNAHTEEVGSFINFDDDGPSISTTGTEANATVDETALTTNATANFASNFNGVYGADGAGTTTFALSVVAGASGLIDTLTNEVVNLSVNGTVVEGRTAVSDALVFTVSVNATGVVTLDQQRAVVHDPNNGPNDTETLTSDDLIKLTATITDKDGDHQPATLNIGQNLVFTDDAPTITAPFDADPNTGGIQTPEHLVNALNQTASGTFGYDIGHDSHPAAFYDATHSDFFDANGALAGIQIGLTGTVDNNQNPNITQAVATLTAETDTSATFAWSFHYDKDPITAGVQDSTAGGTLVFDKVADTYTFTLTDVIDGFSFDVLHTTELLAKAPTGNTGHPLIVAEQLTSNGDPNPFFVQFTANSITQQIGFGFNSAGDGAPVGDTTFNNGGATHDMITNIHEDWVSATQATNGVAGDTIQKGEVLTLRFFNENILSDVNPNDPGGGTERVDPTTSASGVVIKFDGIGNSEDLVLVLDLKDADGNEITRAINVQNSDLIKGNANVPVPYSNDFTLDNNDALLIIEQNDYTVAGETYQIQGIQIMQSANGLTGTAINLNGAIGTNGGSSATSNLTAWDPTDQDVLKIVDIGFVQQTSGTIPATLDFAFNIADADFDVLGVNQHIILNIS